MKKVKLGEVATFINGYAFKPQDWSSEGKEIIRIQNLTKTSTEINYYSGTIDKKYIVEAGDILISWSGTLGVFQWCGRSAVENRECVVFGKGKKERPVYFDARTKIHLRNYLNDRKDSHPALFVTLVGKAQRLGIAGVEIRLRKLGDKLGIQKVHPHKFRRTLATKAIDKGMPIEQVQKLLGHSKIDTTLAYAMVNQNNVKHSHQKFIS
ncbi:integrase/recombinase, phage integrase family protein [Streptococcus pneumoniae]|nr:integrase/recombinase, phage integrase family protein [Streptococcus pneumoniae]